MGALLKVRDLNKSFGGVHALKEVSFDLRDGKILGLIGPNGSGKSTFVNTIAGLHRPDGGKVTLSGMNVTGLNPTVMARLGVARTFQSSRPFLNLRCLRTWSSRRSCMRPPRRQPRRRPSRASKSPA